jgi:hypothetical protein
MPRHVNICTTWRRHVSVRAASRVGFRFAFAIRHSKKSVLTGRNISIFLASRTRTSAAVAITKMEQNRGPAVIAIAPAELEANLQGKGESFFGEA